MAPQHNELPTEHDFDPFGGDLDAQAAWRHFGRLTLREAQAKFRENPIHYQEDFMFMGGQAFAFYFPVIADHLRTVSNSEDGDDREAWVLAHCIRFQFQGANLVHVRHLATNVRELARFVFDNIGRFTWNELEQQRITAAWLDLVRHLDAVVQEQSPNEDAT